MRVLRSATLACFLLLAARADAQPSADSARADQLFQEADKLMADGKYAEACPKLVESRRLDPLALGTLLNLARCHEEQGKTASAYEEYSELRARAEERGQADRVAIATRRAADLEKRLSRVTVKVKTPIVGEAITLDGRAIAESLWGTAIPVDPGDHVVAASIAANARWTQKLTVAPGPSESELVVPPLEAVSPPPPPTSSASAPPDGGSPKAEGDSAPGRARAVVGYVMGGVGLTAIGFGAYFGLHALSLKHDVDALCPTGRSACGANASAAQSKYDSAGTSATLSTLGFGVGVVAVAVAAVLIVSASSGEPAGAAARVRVAPSVGARDVGVSVEGRF